jgi:two-component system, response regulator
MNELRPILLVEDDPNDSELTLMALDDCNLANRVHRVQDGVEAMEFLNYEGSYKTRKKEIPAVVLLDIKMPRMSGIEVLESIRNDEKLKTLPVVMLTSSREDPDLVKCYELGANAYIVKPVDFKEFMDSVKKIGVFWALMNEIPPQAMDSNG